MDDAVWVMRIFTGGYVVMDPRANLEYQRHAFASGYFEPMPPCVHAITVRQAAKSSRKDDIC